MDENNINPNTVKYSILQDIAYRKNSNLDQGLDISDALALGFDRFDAEIELNLPPNKEIIVKYRDGIADGLLRLSADNTHFYNPETGFSAFVVKDGDTNVITFRGTDTTLSILGAQLASVLKLR